MKYLVMISFMFLTAAVFPQSETCYREDVIAGMVFVDADEDLELGFDTAAYLPEGFDPHSPTSALHAIFYMQEELILEDWQIEVPVSKSPSSAL